MKKKDLILILVLVLISVAGLAAAGFLQKDEGAAVVVTVDRQEYGRYPLSEDRTIEVSDEAGRNVIVIKNGQVDVTEADCPDKICVDHAIIRYDHETIVCLPHKLVVEIVGGETSDVDVTTR